jgi:NADH dehydrogenase FAD-containing subunit
VAFARFLTDGFRVVIVGGGFGGLHAAQSLRKAPIEITLLVEPDLTLPRHPEIFVIGDVVHARGPAGNPLPGVATVCDSTRPLCRQAVAQSTGGRSNRTF